MHQYLEVLTTSVTRFSPELLKHMFELYLDLSQMFVDERHLPTERAQVNGNLCSYMLQHLLGEQMENVISTLEASDQPSMIARWKENKGQMQKVRSCWEQIKLSGFAPTNIGS